MGGQTYLPIEILDYVETHAPAAESPYGISQRELAKSLGYHPCSVSRPLARLVAEGLLESKRGLVRDGVRRQITYRLTDRGRTRLKRETRDVPLLSGEIPPPPSPFLGRHDELDQLAEYSRGAGSVIFVDGPPGMGKTALLSRFLRRAKRGRIPFWFTARVVSSPRQFVTALSHSLSFLGKPQLAYYAQLPRNPIARECADLAARALEGRALGTVIDDLHLAGPDLRAFLGEFIGALGGRGDHRFYLVGQHAVSLDTGPLRVGHLVVGGLDRASAHELTDRQGGLADRFEAVYQATLGSPLLLKLAVSQPGVAGQTVDLPSMVVGQLAHAELRAITPAAVANEPLPEEFLLEDRALSDERLRELARIGILQKSLHNRVEVLQAVRTAVLAHVDPGDEREAHHRLARYYGRSHRPETVRERFLHLVAAEDWRAAAELLDSRERDLLRLGYSDALRAAIRTLVTALPSGAAKVRSLFTEATLLRQHSDYSEAILSLRRAHAQAAEDDRTRREALLAIVDLDLRLGQVNQAEEVFAEAERIAATSRRIDAFVILTQARLAEGRGESRKAADGYQRAFEAARRAHAADIGLESIAAWSRLAELTSGPDAALRVVSAALQSARQSGRMDVVFNLRLVRARALSDTGRQDLAEAEIVAIRSEAESLGYLNQLTYAFSGLAAVAFNRGEWSVGASYARQASELAERLGNNLVLGHTLATLAAAEFRQVLAGGSGNILTDGVEHARRAVEVLRQLPPSDSLVLAHSYLTEMYAYTKRIEDARSHYEQAVELAERLGLAALKAQIVEELLPKVSSGS